MRVINKNRKEPKLTTQQREFLRRELTRFLEDMPTDYETIRVEGSAEVRDKEYLLGRALDKEAQAMAVEEYLSVL